MFDLKHDQFDVLVAAIVDHPLLLAGVCTVIYSLIWGYYNGQSRKLAHIPSTGSHMPLFSYIGALNYLLDSKNVVNTGVKKWPRTMFKIPNMLGWLVVATEHKVIEEVWKAPDHVLSLTDAIEESFQISFTLGEHMNRNPYHLPIMRGQLTRSLPQLVPEVHEEIADAFNELIPLTDDWTGVRASEIFMKIVCRATNRVFVGVPLCRNPDFLALNVQFTMDVVQTSALLRLVPRILRPFVNKLVSNIPKRMRHGLKHLAPLIDARRKEREEKGDSYEKPIDFLSWLLDEAKGEEATDWYLTSRILGLNFASIHTSSMTFTHGFYYLAAFPEYMEPLREEVEEIIKREGWTKEGMDQMYKLDSFIKESQRLHPLQNLMMGRVARQNYTFSDGTTVPRGATVTIAVHNVHMNDKIYPEALTFDPFRFVKLKEQDITGRRFDMANTSGEMLAFSHGRHACPGRFFAACKIKLMLAHVVMNYDVKLENEGRRPEDMWVGSSCVPNRNAKVLFRRRVV